ncbi:hypothetical protein HOG98_05595 [bacterium]|jgi:hypothetical protein|nr:hypothetical protein [bacterium]
MLKIDSAMTAYKQFAQTIITLKEIKRYIQNKEVDAFTKAITSNRPFNNGKLLDEVVNFLIPKARCSSNVRTWKMIECLMNNKPLKPKHIQEIFLFSLLQRHSSCLRKVFEQADSLQNVINRVSCPEQLGFLCLEALYTGKEDIVEKALGIRTPLSSEYSGIILYQMVKKDNFPLAFKLLNSICGIDKTKNINPRLKEDVLLLAIPKGQPAFIGKLFSNPTHFTPDGLGKALVIAADHNDQETISKIKNYDTSKRGFYSNVAFTISSKYIVDALIKCSRNNNRITFSSILDMQTSSDKESSITDLQANRLLSETLCDYSMTEDPQSKNQLVSILRDLLSTFEFSDNRTVQEAQKIIESTITSTKSDNAPYKEMVLPVPQIKAPETISLSPSITNIPFPIHFIPPATPSAPSEYNVMENNAIEAARNKNVSLTLELIDTLRQLNTEETHFKRPTLNKIKTSLEKIMLEFVKNGSLNYALVIKRTIPGVISDNIVAQVAEIDPLLASRLTLKHAI